jgi:hypothetical protein
MPGKLNRSSTGEPKVVGVSPKMFFVMEKLSGRLRQSSPTSGDRLCNRKIVLTLQKVFSFKRKYSPERKYCPGDSDYLLDDLENFQDAQKVISVAGKVDAASRRVRRR